MGLWIMVGTVLGKIFLFPPVFLSLALSRNLFSPTHSCHVSPLSPAQLPQIWTIVRAGSAEGLSLASALLSLYSISGYLAYCIAQGFPIG